MEGIDRDMYGLSGELSRSISLHTRSVQNAKVSKHDYAQGFDCVV